MVQITHARVFDEDGTMVLVAASSFDKISDGKKTCLCPDEGCRAELSHYKAHRRTYYDQITGEPYSLKIPDFYQRMAGSPDHDPSCTAIDHYTRYTGYARSLGGVSLQHGAFVYNLNIPVDNNPAPIRRPRLLSGEFAAPARAPDQEDALTTRQKLSLGLNDVQKLAGLLDRTQFDQGYRESILLRRGTKYCTLADIFENDPVALFKKEHLRSKNAGAPAPVLVQFKPIALAKFHSARDLTIQGQAVSIRGADGQDYSVSVKLHCGTEENYKAVKDSIREGKRSFLVYAEQATVDLFEFAQKKKEIADKTAKDRAVFVHVRINRPEQIATWTPQGAQLGFAQAGMDLPVQSKPPREIPEHLIK